MKDVKIRTRLALGFAAMVLMADAVCAFGL